VVVILRFANGNAAKSRQGKHEHWRNAMRLRRILLPVAATILVAGIATAGYLTRDTWLPWFVAPASNVHAEDKHAHASGGESQQVKLTPQAQSNLRLVAKPLKVGTFWRTAQVPGMIVDRPAYSDRGIIAPVTGVVTKVYRFPGDTVRPGEKLFTLRLLSETLQLTQSELFKTAQEIQITQEKKKRLSALASSGSIPESTIIEIDSQLRRLTVSAQAYRQELLTRGLTPDQIDNVSEGKYVSAIEVKAPQQGSPDKKLLSGSVSKLTLEGDPALSFEVQELKVDLGQQVQAGQTLALLSNHQSLYIEGRGFRQETPLVEKAAKEGWPIEVEFMEEPGANWPPLKQEFVIRHLANTIDPATRTFAFYVPLSNQSRTFEKDGKEFLLWRFRPGQKVRLHLKVEKFESVFILPADAIVREGPEAYVFRQNGDLFDRKPVRVVYQDRQHVVIANDGSIPPGVFVAQNGATQLNRVLKSQSGSPSGVHVHADGTVHANH
jgi:cobalt-zinc-cadmium efflux system membrane fusion protein